MKVKVFGNKATKRSHTGWRNDACRLGEIKKSNQVKFESLAEADKAGYKRCKLCCPVSGEVEEQE